MSAHRQLDRHHLQGTVDAICALQGIASDLADVGLAIQEGQSIIMHVEDGPSTNAEDVMPTVLEYRSGQWRMK